jgi:hypothetical protein
LSLLLSNLGFDSQQIETLRRQHLEQVVTSFIAVVQERIISGSDGERLYKIISRRFGLDGEPPETLESLGKQFGVSRERIRQLEEKTIRRCRHKARLHATPRCAEEPPPAPMEIAPGHEVSYFLYLREALQGDFRVRSFGGPFADCAQ